MTQKPAWHMLHHIRETWNAESNRFAGPVESDDTYIGGKEGNKHQWKKLNAGRGAVGKVPVVGVKDRAMDQVWAEPVERTDGATMSSFVSERTMPDAKVYTDEAVWFNHIQRVRESVNHRIKEFVRGEAHTNGIEAFWSMLKRGHYGVFHHFSEKSTCIATSVSS